MSNGDTVAAAIVALLQNLSRDEGGSGVEDLAQGSLRGFEKIQGRFVIGEDADSVVVFLD